MIDGSINRYHSFLSTLASAITAIVVSATLSVIVGEQLCIADGTITGADGTVIQTYRLGQPGSFSTLGCNDTTVGCDHSILRILSNITFFRSQITGGMALAQNSTNTLGGFAGRLRIDAISTDSPIGDIHAGRFDVIYLPHGLSQSGSSTNDGPGIRINFILGQTLVGFFCTDAENHLRPPFAGRSLHYCTPDAHWGIGGLFAQMQYDPQTGRFAGRWAQFNGVLNFFGNGHGSAYVKRHLNLILGASVDTVWPDGLHSQSDTDLRAVAGLSGVVRTEDSHWDFAADFFFRPSIVGTSGTFQNLGLSAHAQISRNFLMSDSTVGTLGLAADLSYCDQPGACIEPFATDSDKLSVYVGAVFGVTFQYGHY